MATDLQDRLRYWVRTLGNLLGETIVEQEGEEMFAQEEELRAIWRSLGAPERNRYKARLPTWFQSWSKNPRARWQCSRPLAPISNW